MELFSTQNSIPVTMTTAFSLFAEDASTEEFMINTTSLFRDNSSNTDSYPYGTYVSINLIYPLVYALPMFGYIMPFLLVVTIIANTLIVIVLSKQHMKTPTNLVLMNMALADMFTLLIPSPWLFYMYTLGNHEKPVYPVVMCYAFNFMIALFPTLFHTASIWLTLALAVQRYIYICHAQLAHVWCTIPRVTKGIGWIYFFAFLHQSTRFFDRVLYHEARPNPGTNKTSNDTINVCVEESAAWVKTLSEQIYFSIYFWFRVLFVHLIPCAALVVLNVLLYKAMRDAQKKREKLFKENRKNECKKLRDSNCTTLMLIAVVTVFLLVEIPLAVITFMTILDNYFSIGLLSFQVSATLILFTNFFIMISYPINFAIYCGMSRQFRETFKELFIWGKLNTRREGSSRYSLVNGPRTCTNESVL